MVQVLFILFSFITFDSSLIHIFAITYGSSLIFIPRRNLGRYIKIALSVHPANLMKLHRKVKHNEKACNAQELDSHVQGQGIIGLEVKLCLKSCLSRKLISYFSKFNETSQKR